MKGKYYPFRLVKATYADGHISYNIQAYSDEDDLGWQDVYGTGYDTIEQAMLELEILYNNNLKYQVEDVEVIV